MSYLQLGDEGHEVEGYGDRLPEAGQVSGAAPVRDPLAPVGVPLLQSYIKKTFAMCPFHHGRVCTYCTTCTEAEFKNVQSRCGFRT